MAQSPHPPPNILWIFGDQHRACDLGWAGNPQLHTPHLDRLAEEGIYFPRALSTCPLCCPARGTLLTSRFPHKTVPAHEAQLDPRQPTVATPFREAGYHTAYIGKWHLDGFKERAGRAAFHVIPPERRGGFDYWVGYENNNSQWDCWVHGTDRPEPERLPGYETVELTSLFLDHLQDHHTTHPEQPFFGVLSIQPPHDPFLAPAEYMRRHTPGDIQFRPNVPPVARIREQAARRLAGYYAAIECFDDQIGRIREALSAWGLADNTLIIFFSDHGDLQGSHGLHAKTSPYAESLHVPMIISGGVPYYEHASNRSFPDPIGLVDLAPTSLGLCGLDVPDWMEGYDYSPRFQRHGTLENAPGSGFAQLPVPTGHGNSVDRPWRCVVTDDGWKYATLEGQPWMLFDLNEDPYELANHAYNPRSYPQRQCLHDLLAGWIERTGDDFPLPER